MRKTIVSRNVKFDEDVRQDTYAPEITEINEITEKVTPIVEVHQIATPKTTSKGNRSMNQLSSNLGSYWSTNDESESESEITQSTYAHAYLAYTTLTEPQSYNEAVNSTNTTKWQQAMNEEYASLIENKSWDLTPLPDNHKVIPTRWLYKIKYKSDGTIERFKARFVAKGFAQAYGIDYDETFSPVFKFTSLRSLLTIAACHDIEIHHMDVKTAFLNET